FRQFARDPGERFHVGSGGLAEHRRHHGCQTDLRRDALQNQHVTVAGGNNMTIPLTTHHKAHHLATDVAPPPATFQGPIGPAEGVDHCGHLRVGFAEKVEHTLCGQVTRHLLPHDVAQVLLRVVVQEYGGHREI